MEHKRQLDHSILHRIRRAPIVPTILPIPPDALCRYIRTLNEEGYPALEVLCRPVGDAIDAVASLSDRPERTMISIGIGTVLTREAAEQAARLRPDFIVSPAFSRRVLAVAAQAGIPYIPGVRTFQDVQNVLDAFEDEGLTVELLKLCPVDGLTDQYVEMLANCFPGILYCPTGEVTLDNFVRWKTNPYVAAPMGSEMVPLAYIEDPDPCRLRNRLRQLRSMPEQVERALTCEVR